MATVRQAVEIDSARDGEGLETIASALASVAIIESEPEAIRRSMVSASLRTLGGAAPANGHRRWERAP
jgi:hypothetical protein